MRLAVTGLVGALLGGLLAVAHIYGLMPDWWIGVG